VLNKALDEGCEDVDDSFGLEGEVERTRGLGFEFLLLSHFCKFLCLGLRSQL